MRRFLLGLILFAIILGAGVVWTVKPGSDEAYEAARTRIAEAIEDDVRVLRFDDLTNLGELPPELGDATKVVQIILRGTVISDISVLSRLKNLSHLNLRETLVSDLSPIADLPHLENLDVGKTWTHDLEPLTRMPALERLDVGTNWVASLEPLMRVEGLDWLNLHDGFASDGSATHYNALKEKGVTVNNGRAFRANYQPGWWFRQQVRFERLKRRVQLGLGALK